MHSDLYGLCVAKIITTTGFPSKLLLNSSNKK